MICFRQQSHSLAFLATDIEPGQTTLWAPEAAFVFAARQLLQPIQRRSPIFGLNRSQILLLSVKGRIEIVTHQRKEAGDDICFITAPQDVEVDSLTIEDVTQEGRDGKNGNESDDSDDVLLLVWSQIM